MKAIFTAKERKVILFLSALLLVGNGVRWFNHRRPDWEGKRLRLGSLEPADSAEVARLLDRSMELKQQREEAKEPEYPLDLNRAELWELVTLPGIGPSRASRIIEERKRRGGFQSRSDLLSIPGIGEKTLTAIEDLVRPLAPDSAGDRTEQPLKVDLNRGTLEEFESLPGIGPALAGRIVRSREEDGPFGSIEEVTRVKGIGGDRYRDIEPFLTVTGRRRTDDLDR